MIFFRRTNKGDGRNKEKRSKIKPLAILMQRRTLWMLGEDDLILDEYQKYIFLTWNLCCLACAHLKKEIRKMVMFVIKTIIINLQFMNLVQIQLQHIINLRVASSCHVIFNSFIIAKLSARINSTFND